MPGRPLTRISLRCVISTGAGPSDGTAAGPPGTGPADGAISVERAGRPGRLARHCATAVAVLLLLTTTLFGRDGDFPFAPFRMYATRDDPDGVVRILEVEAVAADGSRTNVTEADGAPRRAELEGRIEELRRDSDLLQSLAEPYVDASPSAVELRVVWREYRLVGGRSQPPQDRVLMSIAVDGSR